jgi:hypothetical protein
MWNKTEKGRAELRPGVRTLSQRERTVLLLAGTEGGSVRIGQLFPDDSTVLIGKLLQAGYLVLDTPHDAPQPPDTPSTHGDPFAGGVQSLAAARMFLFDMSERLFAPLDKAQAERYRTALREAREPSAMLAVGHALIDDVETLAGTARASHIRDRLTRLLPATSRETSIAR